MNFGLILIGDELLNGYRQDKHLSAVIERLQAKNLSLSWVKMIGDDHEMLVNTFKDSFSSDDVVFSFGGIGATPDDLTRACVAEACDVPLQLHEEAQSLIEDQFGEASYPNRILMAELPKGARLIPNSINQIPGFSVKQHHFVPGFPNMAWPMIEWLLENEYSALSGEVVVLERRWFINGQVESNLLPMMNELLHLHQGVKLSSLPNTEKRHVIDFGIKGEKNMLENASRWLEDYFVKNNIDHVIQRKDI
ncbi:MAG: Competence/damage-inducible protein A [uncultured Thiotrichaceae bacterium]|uniref:Competence/damage-inducible protein A n=1 Tax=uncultured Thiotrichaceae bacterium TaxID=298394 RepID=A0A6S6TN53_9GAMM|nr:MAG: Competence/damage-inducible protein A [uncultured Thiotrichaceae bacterium]